VSVVQSGECFESMLLISLVFHVVLVEVLLDALAKLRKKKRLLASSMSVRPSAWNNSVPTGRVFMKFDT
jgi:hypothetical protein